MTRFGHRARGYPYRRMRRHAALLAFALVATTAPAAGAAPACFGRRATIVGDRDGGSLRGTPGDDVIVGGPGTDFIDGRGGNDRICGGSNLWEEEDWIKGGPGDDLLDGGVRNDLLYGGRGADYITGNASYDLIHAGPGDDVARGADGSDRVFGGPGDDKLYGGDSPDYLLGDTGDDKMDGGEGSDAVMYQMNCCDYSYNPDGVVVDLPAGTGKAPGEADTLTGIEDIWWSPGDDTLIGTDADNWIRSGDGEDIVDAGGGDDYLIPDDPYENPAGGTDHVDGGSGTDWVRYDGFDPMTVDLAAGRADGGDKGPDELVGIENVYGSYTTDTLSGDAGDNELVGGPSGDGNESGDDYLDGREASDVLDGADGTDTCVNGETLRNCP